MNKRGIFAGSTETPLSKEGRAQAREAGKQAKRLKIDYIVCSPQGRAVETAKIIAKAIGYPLDKIHINSFFVERHFGNLEGQPHSPDIDIESSANVETVDTMLKRAKKALKFLETLPAENILVVSHGSFGRALRQHVLQDFPFDNINKLPNAEILQWL